MKKSTVIIMASMAACIAIGWLWFNSFGFWFIGAAAALAVVLLLWLYRSG